jgi:hypothetical protein
MIRIAFGFWFLSFVWLLGVIHFFPFEDRSDPLVLHGPFGHWAGKAFTCYIYVPYSNPDATENPIQSTLQLFEDDKPLGPAHISFSDVATKGEGRFMYWAGTSWTRVVVFSSSDGTSPNTNGRAYRVFDPEAVDPYLARVVSDHG